MSDPSFNQPPPFADVDLFTTDTALRGALAAFDPQADAEALAAYGRLAGSARMMECARLANEFPPRLHTHDATGERIDEVEFHPAWHELMAASARAGLHQATLGARRFSHVQRAALVYLASQMEAGHVCPLTMTHAAAPVLAATPEVGLAWMKKIRAADYDARSLPMKRKKAVTLGMGMTERQGGSDVRANRTEARPLKGREYVLDGHKWFLSAPMSDAFLITARAPGGISCFLVPRLRDDGSGNGLHLVRLKDKLGNRSNASAEVEIEGARGWLLGEEGQGIRAIIPMVNLTRLDTAASSAGLMRQALALAAHHARHRKAFGRLLIDQPLMRAVLADLALEAEGAVVLALRTAAAWERAEHDGRERALSRLLLPLAKFTICKRLPTVVTEAMEVLGGNGYVETFPMARLYREAPLNAIWEGSGNVIALDLLRAIRHDEEGLRTLLDEVGGDDDTLRLLQHDDVERHLRLIAERLADRFIAASLEAHGPQDVAAAWRAARLEQGRAATYGAVDIRPAWQAALLARVAP